MKIIVYDIEILDITGTNYRSPIELVQECDVERLSEKEEEDIVTQLVEEFENSTRVNVVFYAWKIEK